jgi:hypothetical protein
VLFDLRGKRKRAVQVVYAGLALIFLVGFVGFSIGSGNAPGGLLDAIGLGGNSNSGGSLSTQFDDQINAANAQLAKHPNDPTVLQRLAKYEYFKGKQGVSQDQTTGQVSVSQDAHAELGHSADAWEKYLKVNKGKPDPGTAAYMVQAYFLLNDASGAAQAQRIVAEKTPSAGSYGQLAFYLYAAFDIPAGDAAAKKAESLAPKAQRKQISSQLDAIRKQAVKVKKAQAKAQAKAQKNAPAPTAPGANPLQNPFGGVGGGP